MNRRTAYTAVACCAMTIAVAYSATSYTMKCSDENCSHTTDLALGPTMQCGSITGYCRSCSKFVTLSWKTRDMATGKTNIEPGPKALGEVWDSQTGHILNVYACPQCKGPFAEIKGHDEVTHCPKCNKPGFGINKDAPVMEID